MAFFDYDRNGKKDWKEDDASKHSQGKKESSDDGKSNVGCGSVLLCFLFMFCMMWFAMMVDSLCK